MELLGLPLGQVLALFGAAGTAVTGLYLLRPRLRRLRVPFAPLWESLLSDRRSARLLSRLRRILSFALALSVVALLTAALGDPSFSSASARARHIVLLLDSGISMQATDVEPSRFSVARREAGKLIDGLAPSDRMLIARMDAGCAPLSTMTSDRRELYAALEHLEPGDVTSDFTGAYRFSLDVLREKNRPEIILISDGVFERDRELEKALAQPAVPIRYLPVGKRGRNLSITALSARRYPLDKNSSEILLELRNGSPRRQEVEITLHGDGAPLKTGRLDLPPRRRVRRFFRQVFGVDRVLEARMILAGNQRDDLAVDDRAYAVLPERRKARVLCVSQGNLYLQAALLLDEYLEVREITPSEYPDETAAANGSVASPKPAPSDGAAAAVSASDHLVEGIPGYDLVVFDRYVPAVPPAVPAIYIYPSDSEKGFPLEVVGTIKQPYFERLQRGHGLLRWTALEDVNVAEALKVRTARRDSVVAADRNGALLVTGERNGQRFVAFTFDIRKSDLPLRVAWPLLLLNSIDWLIEERDGFVAGYKAGESRPLPLPAETSSAEINAPDGERQVLEAAAGGIVFAPERAGLYTVRAEEAELFLPVNPDCGNLDSIAPQKKLQVAGRPASRPRPAHRGPRERLWIYFVLAALAVVTVEWFTYHRRWTV